MRRPLGLGAWGLLAVAVALLGGVGVAQGVWIHAKARLGQALIARAWQRSEPGGAPLRPWPWADTWPVARLQVPELGVDLFVLAGGTGRTLAWGPGHLAGTALPGGPGNAVVGGHRDTHFAFLRDLAIGSEIRTEDVAGRRRRYRVTQRFVTDEHDTSVLADGEDGRRLTLVTCWPFDALEVGGPERYVVVAEGLPGRGAQPEDLVDVPGGATARSGPGGGWHRVRASPDPVEEIAMDVVLVERGFQFQVEGLDEPVNGRPAAASSQFASQQAQIEDALRRIPTAHLGAVPMNIIVGDRPSSGGAFVASPPSIGLNRRTFGETWNRRFLFTLLHEIGHAVDRRFRIVTGFIRSTGRSGADWSTYRAIEYRGRNRIRTGPDAGTPAYGEHFAEGYAHLLTRPHALTRAQQTLLRRVARM